MRKKNEPKQNETNLKNKEGKNTNFGNELLDVHICREGTSSKLRVEHDLHHVHIFYEGKRVRHFRRGGSRIQVDGLPFARQGEKISATVRRSSNSLWTRCRENNRRRMSRTSPKGCPKHHGHKGGHRSDTRDLWRRW